MINYYYSKFDNVNWSWWKAASIPPEILARLNHLNKQFKGLYPANMLVYHFDGQDRLLISSRGQIDRDQAGRAFSFRHFALVPRANNIAEWQTGFEDFYNPKDYHFPEKAQKVFIAEHSDENKRKNIFKLLLDHCLNGDKLCIIDPDITKDIRSGQEIDQMCFANFPHSDVFLQALRLLPLALAEKISFCLNYEDNFINPIENRLAFIGVIFCGKRSIVAEDFHLEANINFELLTASGFLNTELGDDLPPDTLAAELYGFLTNEYLIQERQHANQCFDYLARRAISPSLKLLTRTYLQILSVFSPRPGQPVDHVYVKGIIDQLLTEKELARTFLSAYFRQLEKKDLISYYTDLDMLSTKIGFPKILEDSIATIELVDIKGMKEPVDFLLSELFGHLREDVRVAYAQYFMKFPADFTSLADDNKYEAYRLAINLLPVRFNGGAEWKKIHGSSKAKIKQFDQLAVKRLAELTHNTKEYSKYLHAIEPEPEKPAKNITSPEESTKLDPPGVSGPINNLNDCYNFWPSQASGFLINHDAGNDEQMVEHIKVYLKGYESLSQLVGFLSDLAQNVPGHPLILLTSQRVTTIVSYFLVQEQPYTETLKPILDQKRLNNGIRVAIENCLDQLLPIEQPKAFYRLLYVFDAINTPPDHVIFWVNKVLKNEKLLVGITELTTDDKIKERLVAALARIKGRKKLNLPPGFELKSSEKIILFLQLHRIKITLTAAIILISAIAFWLLRQSAESAAKQSDDGHNLRDTVAQQVKPAAKMDTLAINQNFLDTSFFKKNDTLTLEQFNPKRKNHEFIKFNFSTDDFSSYKIVKLDSIIGNNYWNSFIPRYEAGKYDIRFETLHKGKDSVSRALHLKITPTLR